MAKEFLVNLITTGLEATSFAFSFKQRQAIKERDQKFGIKENGNKNGCQFPYSHKCSGKIHIHHILPEMYQKHMGIPNPDTPDIAIAICDKVHVGEGGIHPDNVEALKKYHAGNKNSFKEMQEERKEKLEERVIYWNPGHDRELFVLARRNTQKIEIKNPNWWPVKKKT